MSPTVRVAFILGACLLLTRTGPTAILDRSTLRSDSESFIDDNAAVDADV